MLSEGVSEFVCCQETWLVLLSALNRNDPRELLCIIVRINCMMGSYSLTL